MKSQTETGRSVCWDGGGGGVGGGGGRRGRVGGGGAETTFTRVKPRPYGKK